MKKNMYIQPALTVQDIDTESLMASMSLHDEIGDGQLGKEILFEEEEAPATGSSVWDE